MLDGDVADAVKHISIGELNVREGEKKLMDALTTRFSVKLTEDKVGEVRSC